MKKLLIPILLLLSSCNNMYQSGNMYVSSIKGVYENNMCNYYINGSYSVTDITIIDTCGKFAVGDRLNVIKSK